MFRSPSQHLLFYLGLVPSNIATPSSPSLSTRSLYLLQFSKFSAFRTPSPLQPTFVPSIEYLSLLSRTREYIPPRLASSKAGICRFSFSLFFHFHVLSPDRLTTNRVRRYHQSPFWSCALSRFARRYRSPRPTALRLATNDRYIPYHYRLSTLRHRQPLCASPSHQGCSSLRFTRLASARLTSLGPPLARSRPFVIAAASYSQEVLPNSLQ